MAVVSLTGAALVGLAPTSALAASTASTTKAALSTPAYFLPQGTKLTVGHCITSGRSPNIAQLCMEHYGNFNTYFKGALVASVGANSRTNSLPDGYLETVGYDIRVYQGSTGRIIYNYTALEIYRFPHMGIEVSASAGGGWCVYAADNASYFWVIEPGTGCLYPGIARKSPSAR